MPEAFTLAWREPISDQEMGDLVHSHGGNPEPGWWDRISQHSLGWVSARVPGDIAKPQHIAHADIAATG